MNLAASLFAADDVSKRFMFKTMRDVAYSVSIVSTNETFGVSVSELEELLEDAFRFMPRFSAAKSRRCLPVTEQPSP